MKGWVGRKWILGVSMALVLGCGPKMTGMLTPGGYSHGRYAYTIDNKSGGSSLLGDEWELDSAYQTRRALKPKETQEYTTHLAFDLDGDGVYEEVRDALVYDLRYVHRVNSGVIWLRTLPISTTLKDKELRVLMQEYVDGVAGAGYELVNVGLRTAVVEKRFAAEILRRGSGTVGGAEAFAVDVAVANIDQVQVSKDARRKRVRFDKAQGAAIEWDDGAAPAPEEAPHAEPTPSEAEAVTAPSASAPLPPTSAAPASSAP